MGKAGGREGGGRVEDGGREGEGLRTEGGREGEGRKCWRKGVCVRDGGE